MIFKISPQIETILGLEKTIGQYLEIELEKSGFEVTLPTDADWGYVFRIKYSNHLFDVIIKLISESEVSVSVDSTRKLFGKIFPKNDITERNELMGIIESHCKKFGVVF